jgi:hypothetical protein
MLGHHENQLRGEPRVEQGRAEHMRSKLLSLAFVAGGATAFGIVVTSSRQPDGRTD